MCLCFYLDDPQKWSTTTNNNANSVTNRNKAKRKKKNKKNLSSVKMRKSVETRNKC